jgi:hypothetical protein
MRRRLLAAALASAALAACAPDTGTPGTRAAPPQFSTGASTPAPIAAPAAERAPVVEIEADNGAIAVFMRDNLEQMRKYPRALRVASVVGARELDMQTWPGSVIADELRIQARACGTPVTFVKLSDDFDLLVGFTHRDKDGPRDIEDLRQIEPALARNRLRAAQSLADILNVELEVRVDGDRGSAKGKYPFDRWHRYLDYEVPENAKWALLPRLPVETWREQFDAVIAEIGPSVPESDFKRMRTEEFRTRYLDEVMAICPNNFYATLLNRSTVNAPADLVMAVLRDDRVRAGMKPDQFGDVAAIVLNALRPHK